VLKPWTIDQFFEWQSRQPDRYELVNGFPVRMQADARNIHNDIVINILGELRPDAGADCGPRNPDAFKAATPRMVAEVLSPTTRDFDTYDKLAEYKQIESLDTILIVEPNAAYVVVWSRGQDRGWTRNIIEGLDAVVDLPSLGINLPLTEIYDGIDFPGRPRLVRMDDPAG